MNIYDLNRNFVDFSFENPSKIKPNHYALYFFAIEHCNRLGWKKEFGLPTTMTMEAIGIKSYNTYSKTFNELVKYGFFNLIERSKNQYSANIIALSNFNKALDKALDKAFIKHTTKQSESTQQSIDSIDKQIYNSTNIQINNKEPVFNFRKELLNYGFKKELVRDWLKVRKLKKASNSETAFKALKKEFDNAEITPDEILMLCIEKDWKGYKNEWVKNSTYERVENNKNGRIGAKFSIEEAQKYITPFNSD